MELFFFLRAVFGFGFASFLFLRSSGFPLGEVFGRHLGAFVLVEATVLVCVVFLGQFFADGFLFLTGSGLFTFDFFLGFAFGGVCCDSEDATEACGDDQFFHGDLSFCFVLVDGCFVAACLLDGKTGNRFQYFQQLFYGDTFQPMLGRFI